jgi:hypothetical protein
LRRIDLALTEFYTVEIDKEYMEEQEQTPSKKRGWHSDPDGHRMQVNGWNGEKKQIASDPSQSYAALGKKEVVKLEKSN